MKLTVKVEDRIHLAKHAIGLDHKKPYKRHGRLFYRPYRNFYSAGKTDCKSWDALVVCGYAKAGEKNKYGGCTYWLTRKGLDWLGEQLNIHIYDEDD